MEGAVEDHDAVLAGVAASDLDGVFHCLSAGGEEAGLLFVGAWGQLVEFLGYLDKALVRSVEEAGVGEVASSLGDGFGNALVGGADGSHGDAGCEVDDGVAVDVDKHATVAVSDVRGVARDDASGDVCFTGGIQLLAAGARDCGGNIPLLGETVLEILHAVCSLMLGIFYDVGHSGG